MRIALIQMTSGSDIAANIEKLEALAAQAAEQGAEFIATPENTFLMEAPGAKRSLYSQAQHAGVTAASLLAKQYGVWLLIGSVAVLPDGAEEKTFNRSLLFNPQGHIVAHYDKIHLFDVDVGDGQVYRESARFLSGEKVVVASISPSPLRGEAAVGVISPQIQSEPLTPSLTLPPQGRGDIKLGLSICYDLRFPQLYRALAKQGAQILAMPSAFTAVTGEAHWHVLLRARAIENTCFVIAPAQTGTHPGGRKTYGHSLVVDPWGKVLADGGTAEGVVMAEIDLNEVQKVRSKLPSLEHDREFLSPPNGGVRG